jgi:hypothetical protein
MPRTVQVGGQQGIGLLLAESNHPLGQPTLAVYAPRERPATVVATGQSGPRAKPGGNRPRQSTHPALAPWGLLQAIASDLWAARLGTVVKLATQKVFLRCPMSLGWSE